MCCDVFGLLMEYLGQICQVVGQFRIGVGCVGGLVGQASLVPSAAPAY